MIGRAFEKMMSWTLTEWLGLPKFRADWLNLWPSWVPFLGGRKRYGLALDGVGHLAIGLACGGIPLLAGAPAPAAILIAALSGILREALQFGLDDTPNPNLVDRAGDILTITLGGYVVTLLPLLW